VQEVHGDAQRGMGQKEAGGDSKMSNEQAERAWTELLEALNAAAGWTDDDLGRSLMPWTFGEIGQVGYPLALLAEATGTTQEALGGLFVDRGYSLFTGVPSGELQEACSLTPGAVYVAIEMRHLPLGVLFSGYAEPAAGNKRDDRSELRDLAWKVIIAWSKTDQGAQEIGPFTGC
jgi:hypothetical protein